MLALAPCSPLFFLRKENLATQTDRNAGPHKRLPQRNEKRTGRGHCKTQGRRRAHRRATGPPPRGSEGKSQVRCRQGEKGWRGMLLGEEVSAVSAALGAAVVDAGLDEHVARKAHKVRQTRRRARPPFTRARRAVVRVRGVRLEVVKAHRARHGCGGRSASHAGKFGGEDTWSTWSADCSRFPRVASL